MSIQNSTGSPDDPADGSGRSTDPTSADCLLSKQITSAAWEGWWWELPVEESATDSEIAKVKPR